MSLENNHRRVVITGLGVIAPNGKDLQTFWSTVRNGVSAAGPVTRFDTIKWPVRSGTLTAHSTSN